MCCVFAQVLPKGGYPQSHLGMSCNESWISPLFLKKANFHSWVPQYILHVETVVNPCCYQLVPPTLVSLIEEDFRIAWLARDLVSCALFGTSFSSTRSVFANLCCTFQPPTCTNFTIFMRRLRPRRPSILLP